MKTRIIPGLLLAALSQTTLGANPGTPLRGFISSAPAEKWENALVSGNGRLGAMMFAQPLDETIILNHARLFMPLHQPLPPVDTASHLKEIRQMLAEGRNQQAADYVVELSQKEGYGGKRWTDPFIPAFDLKLKTEAQGAVKNYQRSVDFQTGVASVRWEDERGGFQRRLFVSRPDDLVALSITGSKPGSVDCQLRLAARPTKGVGGWVPEEMFKNGIKEVLAGVVENTLTYRSAFRQTWPGSLQGYEGAARVIARGGRLTAKDGAITVKGADEILVLLRIELLKDYEQSQLAALGKGLGKVQPNFDALLARHARVHGGIFNRVKLDLGGGSDRELTSEALLAKSSVGHIPPALLEKEFDAARYNIISSSGDLFPNLQGIWGGTWGPPWSGDFTLNGNVQSAIAADLPASMAECLLPFFSYLESQLPQYRDNAKRLYGCRGIHVPSRASSHGWNNHFDGTWPMTFWTAGAGWASQFYYDYYLYTGDKDFLRNRAMPFMREAALFYEDFLIEGPDGKWLFSPSYSPENNPANNPSQACVNATMDISVARELLGNLIAACQTLGLEAGGVKRWRGMLAKMPDYMISKEGAVKEWTTPGLEDNYAHRHCSHLYAIYNGLPAEIAANPALRAAFDIALEKRMDVRRQEAQGKSVNGRPPGEMAFGLVYEALSGASLKKAGVCDEVVNWLANNYWNPNFVSTHNPKAIFNTDISGGLPAILLRMLVDSQPGWVELLPALPSHWSDGRVEGARCRGQIELHELAWTGKSVNATFRSAVDQTIEVRYPGGTRPLKLPAGEDVSLSLQR